MLAKIVGPRRAFNTPEGERGVAVGRYLATKLGVTTGQSISITVPVEDKCPTCDSSHIDLSQPAFSELANTDLGNIPVTWEFVHS